MKIVNHLLIKEDGDPYNIWFDHSPNQGGLLTPKHLVLHATQGPLLGTISWFKQASGTSTHLIISEDGDEIVQMVPFNRRAVHAHEYNLNSLGIELEYPGPLLASRTIAYRFIERFGPKQRFETTPQNDMKVRTWTQFQPAQLETLLEVTRLLKETYSFESIIRHEAVNAGKLDPGPLFPFLTFKEKLSGNRETLLEQTRRLIHLRTGPGNDFPTLTESALPVGTPVNVTAERAGWALVEVMDKIDGNPWQMGWIDMQWIEAATFDPVILDHRLADVGGALARLEMPAAGNYDLRNKIKEHRYLVMHITGGTNFQGVINYFKNPSSGVSAHLVIGRDGRVVQVLPFDAIAFHCGFSYWEGDENLNQYSIGIEVDNAGYLSGGAGNWSFKGVPIPDSHVREATHWKQVNPRGWETFPDVQLDTTFKIAEAICRHYGIKEIIGHDEINLLNRLDPGPVFPLQELRDQVYPGENRPAIQVFRLADEAELFEPAGQKNPAQNSQRIGTLGDKSRLQIRDEVGKWVLVRVVLAATGTTNRSRIHGQLGWIEKKTLGTFGGAIRNLQATAFYEQSTLSAKAGPPLLSLGIFPRGLRVRRQVERPRDGYTLVCTLEPVGRLPYLEAWVRSNRIVREEEFQQ
ncbi:MAG TPA: N-acetylmuramoyl-L-alanine amidase [Anaerolineales bacterium]|nr:N-acetylmuramoyl-L-alanine amidase [Anaerolineales bacterium]